MLRKSIVDVAKVLVFPKLARAQLSPFLSLLNPSRFLPRAFLLGILLFPVAGVKAASCLDGYALYSDVQTLLRDRDSLASGKTGSNGYLELGNDGKSQGDFVAKGNIQIKDRSKVFANVTSGGSVSLGSGAVITGTKVQYASVPTCALPQITVLSGAGDINVYNGATVDLAPGAYRDVKVYGNCRLKLRNGIYRFNSLQTYADGRFEFNPGLGNIDVLVANSLAIGDRTQFNFTGNVLPERVRFHSQQTNDLTIGTDIQFRGTLVAPMAKVLAYSRTVFRGAVYAKSIDFQPDVKVFYVPLIPTNVMISNPMSGTSTNDSIIQLSWSVSGTVQTVQTTDTLTHFGANTVKRCFGAVCDSVIVYLDSVEIPTPKVEFRYCADRYLIYSQQTTQLREGVHTVGGDVGSAGHVNVGRQAQVWGSLISSHTAKLEEYAWVRGMVMVGDSLTKASSATVDTQIVEHAVGLQACPIPTLPKISYGSGSLVIPSGTQQNLAPGKYGNVQASSGATLHLTSGAYNFQSLRLDSLAALTIDLSSGPIQINVEVNLSIGRESEIVQVAGDTNETITIYTNQIDLLYIQPLAGVSGIIVAPHAAIWVGDSVEVVGRLYGKDVVLLPGSKVYKQPGPVPEDFPPAPQIPVVTDSTAFLYSLLRQVTPGQTSPTWGRLLPHDYSPPGYGAIGDAERLFAQKMNMGWYEIYGNHGQDANGNQNTLIISLQKDVDPPAGMNMIRKVATIEARNDAHGYGKKQFGEDLVDLALSTAGWYVWPLEGCWVEISVPCIRRWRFRICHPSVPALCTRSKPRFRFHRPQADEMVAADRMQILDAIHRDVAAGRSGKTIWEIGNEPNLFPYLLPQDYANVVRAYYQFIKQADPNAAVAFGSLFDIDFMKADARTALNDMASTAIFTAGVGTWAILTQLTGPILSVPFAAYVALVLDDVRDVMRDNIFFRYSTRQYFSLVLSNLDASIKPEAISAHYYPFDIEGRYTRDEIMSHIANTSAWLSADLYQNRNQFSPVVITETGNINWELDTEAKALPRMVDILDGAIWGVHVGSEFPMNFNALLLWYKPLRIDEKFNGLSSIPFAGIDNPPFTRFLNDGTRDVNFVQALIDADGWSSFCSDINSLGLEYYRRINGGSCGAP